MNWYLIQLKANGYKLACENLKRQGFDVFMPLLQITKKKNGKFVNRNVPLFPGYLFFGTSKEPVPWKSVNGTLGVTKAVTLDGVYRPVHINIIKGLKDRCDEGGLVRKLSDIVSGDRAKIERGPFADFICNVDKFADKKRAWVLITLLQQQTRANISIDDMSKVY